MRVELPSQLVFTEKPNLFVRISGIISRPGKNLPSETVLKIVAKHSVENAEVKNTETTSKGKKPNSIIWDRNILKVDEIKSIRVKKAYYEWSLVHSYG